MVEQRIDLSDVIDIENGYYPECWGKVERKRIHNSFAHMYTFERHPGLYIITNMMPDNFDATLAQDCFTSMLRPPATTNFNKSHGIQICGLWEAAQSGKRLSTPVRAEQQDNNSASLPVSQWDQNGDGPPATEFLKNLRWLSIGPIYDWTERRYRKEDAYVPLPEYLYKFAKEIWSIVCDAISTTTCSFEPNAALINYYREGDKLCGHKDDAEMDQTKPLVSISIGCPAIFLMGGNDTAFLPTPILLRNGDVAILSGKARQAYHGLPRIFPSIRKYPLEGPDESGHFPLNTQPHPSPLQRQLQTCRLNISVRQV